MARLEEEKAKKDMGDTSETLNLERTKITPDQAAFDMKVDKAAEKLDKPNPTKQAAAAIGVTIPDDKELPIDKNTGKPRIKPAVNEDGTPRTAGTVPDENGIKMKVDSLGNIIEPAPETKEDKIARLTVKTLNQRKAENAAESHNKWVDAKIDTIKGKNFQESVINSVHSLVKKQNKADEI